MEKQETKTLFDSLYEKGSDIIKGLQKPFIRKQLKRKFQSAYDDALMNADTCDNEILTLRNDLQNYDLNEVIKKKAKKATYLAAAEAVKQDYKELFGEDFKETE